MGTVSSTKGFTLLEMLLSLFVITGMLLLNISRHSTLHLDHYYFASDCLYIQSQAMIERSGQYAGNNVNFNSMGHVDLARTIDFGQHKVIVHLGNGYVFVQ